jgi:hypothetical protein
MAGPRRQGQPPGFMSAREARRTTPAAGRSACPNRRDHAMSKAKLPPVPPANRAPMGGADAKNEADIASGVAEAVKESKARNLEQQGRQGNIHQNITNQGHQQDR